MELGNPIASITGKPASYAPFAGAVASLFGQSTLSLYNDRIIGKSKKIISGNEVIINLQKVDSVEVATKGNAIWMILGISTLAIYGLGIVFFLVYFLVRERFLIMVSGNNIQAVAIRGKDDLPQFQDFMEKVIETQKTQLK